MLDRKKLKRLIFTILAIELALFVLNCGYVYYALYEPYYGPNYYWHTAVEIPNGVAVFEIKQKNTKVGDEKIRPQLRLWFLTDDSVCCNLSEFVQINGQLRAYLKNGKTHFLPIYINAGLSNVSAKTSAQEQEESIHFTPVYELLHHPDAGMGDSRVFLGCCINLEYECSAELMNTNIYNAYCDLTACFIPECSEPINVVFAGKMKHKKWRRPDFREAYIRAFKEKWWTPNHRCSEL